MLNLHAIVRRPITMLHPDETVVWYRSTGQINVLGRIKPSYAEGVVLQAQIQTLSPDELQQREDASKTEIHVKAYLMAQESAPPAGIIRIEARNGDFIRRADGTWWLITSVLEEFAKSGWESVGLVQQIKDPDIDTRVFGFAIDDKEQTGIFGEAPFFVPGSGMGGYIPQAGGIYA